MYGSSGSNGYDMGGTVNATGLSSRLRFGYRISSGSGTEKARPPHNPLAGNPAPTVFMLARNSPRRRFGTRAPIIPLVLPGAIPRTPLTWWLDARERPSGRFRDYYFRRLSQPGEQVQDRLPFRQGKSFYLRTAIS